MGQKGWNGGASQPRSGYSSENGNYLKSRLPPSFFGRFSSLLIEPGNESLDNIDEPFRGDTQSDKQ